MKKFLRILACTLVLVMGVSTLASCNLFGTFLNGTYEAEFDGGIFGKYTTTYEFKFNKVTVTNKAISAISGEIEATTYEGTYEIIELEDGTMEISIEIENADENVKNGRYLFEQGEDYIIIGKTRYEKK